MNRISLSRFNKLISAVGFCTAHSLPLVYRAATGTQQVSDSARRPWVSSHFCDRLGQETPRKTVAGSEVLDTAMLARRLAEVVLDLWDKILTFIWVFSLSIFYTVLTWYIRTGIFSTNSPFFSPFFTSLVRIDSRSLLGLWGRGDDWGEISGEDGADLRDINNVLDLKINCIVSWSNVLKCKFIENRT